MIRLLVAAIIFGLIGLAIIFMLIVNFTYKGVKKLREEAEDAYYRNQKMKEQKERNPFNGDYFKGSKGRHRASRTQAQYEQREQVKRDKKTFGDDYFKGTQQEQSQQQSKNNTARRTTTSSGVTIIDDRDSEDKRKIFDHSDGEYVEFEEV